MKCVILENLSIITNIESLPYLDMGKPKIKSIEISIQGSLGTCKGVYNLWGITLDLYVMHLS
jgi:glutamate synthase domain-containing protein 3